MTFKALTLTVTFPILLDHIQQYSRTLTLVFRVDSKKTQNYICDEKFTSLCTQ